mmetsp:Transcript_1081/g.2696  ORF Transcript_1081/g.2696 Transcript_1081/m.2696 type:complete len:210 (-) Transcript_1081:2450-3079(-)
MTTETEQPQAEESEDFGLPQPELKPITSGRKKWLQITFIIASLVLSIGAGGIYWFLYHVPSNNPTEEIFPIQEVHDRETTEEDDLPDETTTTISPTEKKVSTSKLANEEVTNHLRVSHNTYVKEGKVTSVNTPQNRYYVVAGSFIDEDLASDHAHQLAKKGVNVTLIVPPQGQYFFRVAIEQRPTFHEAKEVAMSLKKEYGANIWVMKY